MLQKPDITILGRPESFKLCLRCKQDTPRAYVTSIINIFAENDMPNVVQAHLSRKKAILGPRSMTSLRVLIGKSDPESNSYGNVNLYRPGVVPCNKRRSCFKS